MAWINLADQRNYGVYLADLQNIAVDRNWLTVLLTFVSTCKYQPKTGGIMYNGGENG